MKRFKKLTAILAMAICLSMVAPSVLPLTMVTENVSEVSAASISAKKKTIAVGTKFRLRVKGTKKSVKWSSSKKSVATVSSKGLVKGVSAGKATIKAKVGKKTYKCTVRVKQNRFTQKAVKIKKLQKGYLHFYPIKVYYANKKLHYVCRLYNRRSSFVGTLSRVTLTVEAKVDGDKHIIANKTFKEGYEINLNAGAYTNSATDLEFEFSGSSLYDKSFDLTSIKKIYYTASYTIRNK